MPGILDSEEYVNTAILVLLLFQNGEYHFVFQKRNSLIRQGGEVCFPGGIVESEQDKSFQETVIRETYEELGIPEDKLTILGGLDTLVHPNGLIINAFLGVANITGIKEMTINTSEVDYVFTVPVSHFEHSAPARYTANIKFHPTYTDLETGREIVLFPAENLGLPKTYTRPWGMGKYRILVYPVNNEVIWGITAKYVYDVVKKLKQLPTPVRANGTS
jgi:8-oxo-dGTP pyrophosphatase MutT (NUDIX family)